MKRRDFVVGVGAATALGLSGCASRISAAGRNLLEPIRPSPEAFAGEWFAAAHVGSGRPFVFPLRIGADGEGPTRVVRFGPETGEVELDQPAGAAGDGRRVLRGRLIGSDRMELLVVNRGGGAPFNPSDRIVYLFGRDEPPALPRLTLEELERHRALNDAPALGVAAQRRGGARFQLQTGERIRGSGVEVRPDDLWGWQSNSKSVTATAVARMVEAGLLSWDDTVGDFLGDVAPDMRPEYRSVTFRHLLSHRSGLPRDVSYGAYDVAAVARLILAQAPVGPREATFRYSNAGYDLIRPMLETKTGVAWPDLLRRHLFEPLGLSSAAFVGPGGSADGSIMPSGHRQNGRPDGGVNRFGSPSYGPGGGVHMSLAEMIRYLSAHCDRTDLLQSDSWRVLHTPPFGGDYAMGWVIDEDVMWHSGGTLAWKSFIRIDREAGVVAAGVCNQRIETLPYEMMLWANDTALADGA